MKCLLSLTSERPGEQVLHLSTIELGEIKIELRESQLLLLMHHISLLVYQRYNLVLREEYVMNLDIENM